MTHHARAGGFPDREGAPYPAGVRVPRPARPRGRTLGVAGLGLLAGVVGGALAGLVRVPPRPQPRGGEGA